MWSPGRRASEWNLFASSLLGKSLITANKCLLDYGWCIGHRLKWLLVVSRNSFPVKSRKTIISIASLPRWREFYSPLIIFHWSERFMSNFWSMCHQPSIPSVAPLPISQFSLEVKYLSKMLEGVSDGTRATLAMGIRAASFASPSALQFPWELGEFPIWCLWQWMTSTCFSFWILSVRCKISVTYFIGMFLAFRSPLSFQRAM